MFILGDSIMKKGDSIMKKTILIATAALLSASITYAAGEAWMDNFEAAKQKAVSENTITIMLG